MVPHVETGTVVEPQPTATHVSEEDKTKDSLISCKGQDNSNGSSSKVVTTTETILVVPLKLCKTAQTIVFGLKASPLSYHLEGRFGSRTHRIDEFHMGIPVLNQDQVWELAIEHVELRQLLDHPDSQLLDGCPYILPPAHRAREPEELDARCHPERPGSETAQIEANDLVRRHRRNRPFDAAVYDGSSIPPRINDVQDSSSPSPVRFTYAEFFAGTGAFGIALRKLGGQCVFVSELEEHLRTVFCHNFPEVDSSHLWGDITQVPNEAFPPMGTLDLLVGGFPCQPFSSMGLQPGFDCPKSGNLFLQIVRCLKVSKPKAFLLENVPGLLTMTETYNTIIKELEKVGYNVTSEVVSSRCLTCTKRKRLYIVGIRKDQNGTSRDENHPFLFPFIPDLKLRARDVLDYDDLPQEELDILRLADDTLEQLLTSRRFKSHNLAWPNRVCSTLISHYGNAVGRGESQLVPCSAPHAPRRFSVRECARLMGFPDSYKFLPRRGKQSLMGYRKEHYRMIGNAVCPPVIAALAGAVLEHIKIDFLSEDMKEEGSKGTDHVLLGRQVALELACSALRPQRAPLPIGCLLPEEYIDYGYTNNVK